MGGVFFIGLVVPVVATILTTVIFLFAFIGICLVIIGSTGIIMNKIYIKQMKEDKPVSNTKYNVGTIILGIVLILLPLGYALYGIFLVAIN